MKRIIGYSLVAFLALYTTPGKADSYESTKIVLVEPDESTSSQGTECSVKNIPVGQPSLNATDEKVEESTETYADNYSGGESVVTAENPKGDQRAHNKRWQNIFLALAAVTVAIIGLLLVNSHQGHSAK